jgi:mannose/fructose-specific phosphotransferase system component IIA
MSDAVRGLVVAHGGLAEALVREAGQISGEQNGLVAVSNAGGSREDIERRIGEALGDGPAVIFVDMPCGSCFFAAMRFAREREGLRVVTGVNLPMLLDFLNNRSLPPAEGAARAAVKGTDAIRQP